VTAEFASRGSSIEAVRALEVLENAGDAAALLDPQWRFLYVNRALEEMFRRPRAELLGRGFWEVLPGAGNIPDKERLTGSLREHAVHFESCSAEGDLWIEVSAYPAPEGVAVLVRDIGSRKKAERDLALDNARLLEQSEWAQRELQRSNEDLRRANQDLEAFAYSASHDLQEPLRNVSLSAQLLQRALHGVAVPEEAEKFLAGILSGAQRMERLVRDLLAYARAARPMGPPRAEVDAHGVLAGVLISLKSRIEQSRACVTSDPLPRLAIHHVHLAQLLQNLLSNALKYRSADPPRVHIAARREPGWWVFSVADNGIGIDLRYREQIFGLFKRLHAREQYPGSGLGLAVCQRIVEQYGGRIWLERSAPQEGSVFCFSLPER